MNKQSKSKELILECEKYKKLIRNLRLKKDEKIKTKIIKSDIN